MGNAVKVGDMGTDHDGFPPTAVTGGSSTVKIDGIPAEAKAFREAIS